jgi:hypothetical protein
MFRRFNASFSEGSSVIQKLYDFLTPVLQSCSCFKIIYAQQVVIMNSYNNVKLKKKHVIFV